MYNPTIHIIPEPLVELLTAEPAGVSDQQTAGNINQHQINRFSIGNRKIVPSRQDSLIKEIQEDRKTRKKEFNFYKEHLQKSQEQRDRLLNILEQVVKLLINVKEILWIEILADLHAE